MIESMDGIFIFKSVKCIAAGLCMAIGAFATAMGQGFIGGKACEGIGKNPSCAKDIRTTALYTIVAVETSGIFTFVVAMILLFFTN